MLRSHLPFDSILKVEARDTTDPAAIGMSVRIQKGLALEKDEPQLLQFDFWPKSGLWRVVHAKRTKLQELQMVAEHMAEGASDRAIALALGISLASAKQRKRQVRGKEDLPARILKSRNQRETAEALVALHLGQGGEGPGTAQNHCRKSVPFGTTFGLQVP